MLDTDAGCLIDELYPAIIQRIQIYGCKDINDFTKAIIHQVQNFGLVQMLTACPYSMQFGQGRKHRFPSVSLLH